MDSETILGALPLLAIGITLAVVILHFGFFLRNPANLEAAKTVASDRESATIRVTSNTGAPAKPLLQRLNEARIAGVQHFGEPQYISREPWK